MRMRLLLVFVSLVLGVGLFVSAHSHSNEPAHLKYTREINEAAQRGEDTIHDHHGHSHSHHGHSHDEEEDEDDHFHGHHHTHSHLPHGHSHDEEEEDDYEHHHTHSHSHSHDDHSRTKEVKQKVKEVKQKVKQQAKEFLYDKNGYLSALNDPKTRLWTYAIGSTVLISLFPCFILTFIPIQSNADENGSLLRVLLALGAGGLLGDAFLHLIPHAQEASGGHGHSHSHSHSHASGEPHGPHDMSVGGWVLAGLLVFFVVEKFLRVMREHFNLDHGHSHSHQPKPTLVKKKSAKQGQKSSDAEESSAETDDKDTEPLLEVKQISAEDARLKIAAWLNLIADFMHNFTDGLAIGASFLAGTAAGVGTMVGVLIHEIPHEIGDFAILVRSGYSKKRAMLIQLLTALGALTGCIISLWSADPSALADAAQSSWVIPFTAGGFIYVAAVSVLPELLEKSSFVLSLMEVLAMCLGLFCMYLIALYE